jgi:hypothetical protein
MRHGGPGAILLLALVLTSTAASGNPTSDLPCGGVPDVLYVAPAGTTRANQSIEVKWVASSIGVFGGGTSLVVPIPANNASVHPDGVVVDDNNKSSTHSIDLNQPCLTIRFGEGAGRDRVLIQIATLQILPASESCTNAMRPLVPGKMVLVCAVVSNGTPRLVPSASNFSVGRLVPLEQVELSGGWPPPKKAREPTTQVAMDAKVPVNGTLVGYPSPLLVEPGTSISDLQEVLDGLRRIQLARGALLASPPAGPEAFGDEVVLTANEVLARYRNLSEAIAAFGRLEHHLSPEAGVPLRTALQRDAQAQAQALLGVPQGMYLANECAHPGPLVPGKSVRLCADFWGPPTEVADPPRALSVLREMDRPASVPDLATREDLVLLRPSVDLSSVAPGQRALPVRDGATLGEIERLLAAADTLGARIGALRAIPPGTSQAKALEEHRHAVNASQALRLQAVLLKSEEDRDAVNAAANQAVAQAATAALGPDIGRARLTLGLALVASGAVGVGGTLVGLRRLHAAEQIRAPFSREAVGSTSKVRLALVGTGVLLVVVAVAIGGGELLWFVFSGSQA